MGKRDDGNPQWHELHTTLVDGLDRWLAGQPYDIELQRWLDSGNSGAQIAVVSTTGPGTTGKVALNSVQKPTNQLAGRRPLSLRMCRPPSESILSR